MFTLIYRSRPVTSYYETKELTNVLPIMTQPFDFRQNQSFLPRWEETLIFNESFQSLISNRESPEGEEQPTSSASVAVTPIVFFVVRIFSLLFGIEI